MYSQGGWEAAQINEALPTQSGLTDSEDPLSRLRDG